MGVLDDIIRTGTVHDREGNAFPVHSCIDEPEIALLQGLIRSDGTIRKTLEVGCAYGVSSLAILGALAGREGHHHIIIDPFQDEDWNRVGPAVLERAGYDTFELVERRSEFFLPELAQAAPGSIDLVFIDGCHTFDHTMIDLYYANLLLRVGGYVVVDDGYMPGVAKAVSYLSKYPAYVVHDRGPVGPGWPRRLVSAVARRVPARAAGLVPRNLHDRRLVPNSRGTMIALRKVADDERRWDWFSPF